MTTIENRPTDVETVSLENEPILVRQLTREDVPAVVRIDAAATGLQRVDFYGAKIRRALDDSSVQLSLAAEMDGMVVGFVVVAFYYGEFGIPETVAVIEAIGVHPEYRDRGVGRSLMRQLEGNLAGLGVDMIRTEVGWQEHQLLEFLAHCGYEPVPRLCLEKPLR